MTGDGSSFMRPPSKRRHGRSSTTNTLPVDSNSIGCPYRNGSRPIFLADCRRISVPSASPPCSTNLVVIRTFSRRSISCTCSVRTTASKWCPTQGPSRTGGGKREVAYPRWQRQLIYGILDRLPSGALHLDQRLVAVRTSGNGFKCTFECGPSTHDVLADHVVLALPLHHLAPSGPRGRPDQPTPPPGHRGGATRHELEVLSPVRRARVEQLRPRHGKLLLRRCRPGRMGRHGLPARHGRNPCRAARRPVCPELGQQYGLSNYVGQPPPQ